MGYIVNQDIIDRVGSAVALQLTTDSGTVVNQAMLDGVRVAAEREADSYMASRLATPVDLSGDPNWGPAIKGKIVDFAVYKLMVRRESVSEDWIREMKSAIEWFKGVGAGEVVLPGAATPASTQSNDPTAEYGSQAQNASTLREQ